MSLLKINFFQAPIITLDNEIIHFPYKKAEAFFYYMAIEKKSTREYITELLWEDNDEILAKKNLRHALYTINKLFPEPIIISPQKASLIFNPTMDVEIDYDNFVNNQESIDYTGLLLEGFYVKDCLAFEEWLDNKQQDLAMLYSNRLHYFLNNRTSKLSLEEIERIAELCIKDDPLDEKAYKYMMEIYREHKQYHKAINLYQNLTKILDDELGLSPSKSITNLHHELLDLWIADSSDYDEMQPDIKIRDNKRTYLVNAYENFKNDKSENIIVIGENGIGKTYLINSTLAECNMEDILIIDVTCFQAERNYPLQIWNNIFFKLSDYIITRNINIPNNYIEIIETFLPMCETASHDDFSNPLSFRSFQNALLKVFQLVSYHTKIILYIDNITATDKNSLDMLASLMNLKNTNIMVLLTSLDVMNYDLTTFVSSMVRAKYLTEMHIWPLTKEQTGFFVHDSIPDITLTDSDIDRFYEISSGNIFFLVEMINNIKYHHDLNCLSSTAKEILNDRLNGVSPDTRKMLDIISLFQIKAPFSVLEAMTSNQLQLMNNIDEAKELSLISEFKENNMIFLKFQYHQMRDFIYEKIAPSKLRILHNSIALSIEELLSKYPNARYPYKSLAYHFSIGENPGKALYYRLLYMEQLSSIYFELYPVLDETFLSSEDIDLPDDIDNQFAQLSDELASIKDYKDADLYNEMEARLYHAKSRYYVLVCDYEQAITCINTALNNQYTRSNPKFHLDLLKQLIYYNIQNCNMQAMYEILQEGMNIAINSNNHEEQAIFHRFYGFYYMMEGKKKQAIAALLESINQLDKATIRHDLYITNIAAAYNYLGEINLRYGEVSAAFDYYRKSINLCSEKGYTVNATFYTNLGKALFFLGNMEDSRKAFVSAHQVYRRSTAIVGCSTMHSFLAYHATISGELDHAAHHIRMSRRMFERINSPYEKGIYYFVLYILSKEKKQTPFLTKPVEFYEKKCKEYLTPFHDSYILNSLD